MAAAAELGARPPKAYREELTILVRCWVPDVRLREFLEVVVRATIRSPADPRYRPCAGAVWLDGDRLEDRCWENILSVLALTGSTTRSWIGVWWESREEIGGSTGHTLFPWERGAVACELQHDDGYDGVSVRLAVSPDVAGLVRQTAVALGGGAAQAAPGATSWGLNY